MLTHLRVLGFRVLHHMALLVLGLFPVFPLLLQAVLQAGRVLLRPRRQPGKPILLTGKLLPSNLTA